VYYEPATRHTEGDVQELYVTLVVIDAWSQQLGDDSVCQHQLLLISINRFRDSYYHRGFKDIYLSAGVVCTGLCHKVLCQYWGERCYGVSLTKKQQLFAIHHLEVCILPVFVYTTQNYEALLHNCCNVISEMSCFHFCPP